MLFGVMSVLSIPAVQAASADTAGAAGGASILAVCGYNDNIGGLAIWKNCDHTPDLIHTTDWFGTETQQCVAPNSEYVLGPTWFIDNSVLAGFC